MYRHLNADLIVETCRSTQLKIAERFTDSGLSKVAEEILTVSEQAAGLSAWLAKPHWPLRALAGDTWRVVLRNQFKPQPHLCEVAVFCQNFLNVEFLHHHHRSEISE